MNHGHLTAPFQTTKDPALSEAIQTHLGQALRTLYGDPAETAFPLKPKRLTDRVAQVVRAHTEPLDQAYVDGIMAALPNLRAFAVSLTRDSHGAEDLVQETVLKASLGRKPSRLAPTFKLGCSPSCVISSTHRTAESSVKSRTRKDTSLPA
jgi:hypothetical protein